MTGRSLWIMLGVTALLAIGIAWMRFNAPPSGNLAGSSLGGAFALTNQDGKPVTDKDYAGQYRLIYFGYTFCPDVCPTDVGYISRGLADFEKGQPARGARVTPIFVTVDPERDDVAAVKAFTAAFHPRLVGLTGSPAAIDAARKAYGIYAKKVATSDPDNYLVDHFAVIYLFGPDGAPIAFLPHGSTPADVTAMLETYVR
ncbi:SCO family protein [Polymorphobacter fuscus]|uniref:Redoxin domain-containing protein n=1 Tax=Sandarakinorhabdus fusca TaxID=1439888 RepID=A0A7C9GUD0_9SPHN|nr:SCO family protein [Polymorphobacter fuscus]KAB7647606.1 SCO family protein [Polymorphobacter fuscus]MQT16878.1 redoxin domain-containing protein [Polymorphobacter fuscus]NJC09133.1 protein SCO1/2 [Polymorphobacter fuscus]